MWGVGEGGATGEMDKLHVGSKCTQPDRWNKHILSSSDVLMCYSVILLGAFPRLESTARQKEVAGRVVDYDNEGRSGGGQFRLFLRAIVPQSYPGGAVYVGSGTTLKIHGLVRYTGGWGGGGTQCRSDYAARCDWAYERKLGRVTMNQLVDSG